MKQSLVIISALCGVLTTTTFANQATLVNDSGYHPLTMVYRVAFKNLAGPVIYGPLQTIQLKETAQVGFGMNGYQLAGIVPVSIAGHPLPDSVNAFDQSKQCSLTTDRIRDSGTLIIAFHKAQGQHYSLTCGVQGGIFN